MNKKVDRIFLHGSGEVHKIVVDDLKKLTVGSIFLYGKDNKLRNTLEDSFCEMAFVIHKFKEAYDYIVVHGTPELDSYIAQFNSIKPFSHKDSITELHRFDLSTYFKCFITLTKTVLDKLVPLYSYSFNDNLLQFSDKGTRLIKRIRSNRHISKPDELISLIETAKSEWIDDLIILRKNMYTNQV